MVSGRVGSSIINDVIKNLPPLSLSLLALPFSLLPSPGFLTDRLSSCVFLKPQLLHEYVLKQKEPVFHSQ